MYAIEVGGISATRFRRSSGSIAREVRRTGQPLIITSREGDLGALVPVRQGKKLVKHLGVTSHSIITPGEEVRDFLYSQLDLVNDLGVAFICGGPDEPGLICAWVSVSRIADLAKVDPNWYHEWLWPGLYRDRTFPLDYAMANGFRNSPAWYFRESIPAGSLSYIVAHHRTVLAALLPMEVVEQVVYPTSPLELTESRATEIAPHLDRLYAHPESLQLVVVTSHGKPVGCVASLGALRHVYGDADSRWVQKQDWLELV